jgi:hypothetical protein
MKSLRLMSFARTKDYIGLRIEYHVIGSRIVPVVTAQGKPLPCPLWVKSKHWRMSDQCPLCPGKWTPPNALACPLSAKQLCDIRSDPPRLIFGEQFGGRSSAGLIFHNLHEAGSPLGD